MERSVEVFTGSVGIAEDMRWRIGETRNFAFAGLFSPGSPT